MPFTPGKSGNPAGRPRGFRGVAAKIMQETRDGAELVEWALAVWRNESGKRTFAEQAAAHAWLGDRALGKAVQATELVAHVSAGPVLPGDWDRLTAEQRSQWLDELESGGARLAGAGALGLLAAGADGDTE